MGFLHSMDETHISILGGNQGNEVSVRKYPRGRLLCFRTIPNLTSKETIEIGIELTAANRKIKRLESTITLQADKIQNQKHKIEDQKDIVLKLQGKLKDIDVMIAEVYRESKREV